MDEKSSFWTLIGIQRHGQVKLTTAAAVLCHWGSYRGLGCSLLKFKFLMLLQVQHFWTIWLGSFMKRTMWCHTYYREIENVWWSRWPKPLYLEKNLKVSAPEMLLTIAQGILSLSVCAVDCKQLFAILAAFPMLSFLRDAHWKNAHAMTSRTLNDARPSHIAELSGCCS